MGAPPSALCCAWVSDEDISMSQRSLFHDADYVHGQISLLRALILALAQVLPKEQFRKQGLVRLEAVRTLLLSRPVGEKALLAIDHTEEWLTHVTQ
jgi:hypothetical protein